MNRKNQLIKLLKLIIKPLIKNKLFVVIVIVSLIIMGLQAIMTILSYMSTGWKNNHYYINNTMQYDRIITDKKGNSYYVDADGFMYLKQGWFNKDNDWHYIESDGKFTKNRWIEGYYLDSQGKMAKDGLYNINNGKYFFDKDGKKKTGLVVYKNKIYYADENGRMLQSQWLPYKIGFASKDGHLYRDENVTIDGVRYYFDRNGTPYDLDRSERIFNGRLNGEDLSEINSIISDALGKMRNFGY